jgi:hypothetical protein
MSTYKLEFSAVIEAEDLEEVFTLVKEYFKDKHGVLAHNLPEEDTPEQLLAFKLDVYIGELPRLN